MHPLANKMYLQTEAEKYKHLSNSIFIGSGRFLVEPGTGKVKIQHRVSRVDAVDMGVDGTGEGPRDGSMGVGLHE